MFTKAYYPETEYTICKFARIAKIVWQHNRPQDWLALITKYFEIAWEVAAPKYRYHFEFSAKINIDLAKKTITLTLAFIWFYLEIEIGKIEPTDWMEDEN